MDGTSELLAIPLDPVADPRAEKLGELLRAQQAVSRAGALRQLLTLALAVLGAPLTASVLLPAASGAPLARTFAALWVVTLAGLGCAGLAERRCIRRLDRLAGGLGVGRR